MNELDDDMRELLSQARRAATPTAAQEARVLAQTLRAASVPVVAASSLGMQLAAAVAIAAVSGSIGFVLGRSTSPQERVRVVEVAVPAAPVVVEAVPQRPELVVSEPTVRKVPHARTKVAVAEAPVEVVAPVDPFAEVRGNATSSLELEVRFMKAVERALRDNEPGLALRMLDQLDEEVPHGSLDEERLAASVMARCRLGLGNRAKLIEEMSSRYPSSAYNQRVHDSCDRH